MWMILALLLSSLSWAQEGDTPITVLPTELQDAFLDAEAAWQSGRLDEAAEGFDLITSQAADFDRAWRRACGVRVEQRRHARAVALCREAVRLRSSRENRTGLAIALIHAKTDLDEARELIDEVLAEDPSFLAGWQALCSYALVQDETPRLRRCVDGLRERSPSSAAVPLFQALLSAHEEQFDAAWGQLEQAASLGAPDPMLASLRGRISSRFSAHQAQQVPAGTTWSLADAAPLGIVLLLIGGIVVLALSDGREPPSSDADPPAPPQA